MMRLDMISDRCRNRETVRCAHPAQRFDHALSARDLSPSLKLIPVTMTTIVHVLIADRRMEGRQALRLRTNRSLASNVRSQKKPAKAAPKRAARRDSPFLWEILVER